MAQLLVFGVDSPQTAEKVLEVAAELNRQQLLELADIGVDDDLIRRVGDTLQPGRAAVFYLPRNATVDRVIEAIRPYNPTVIQTNLSRDSERELVEALHRDYLAGPTSTTTSS
jgi:uncharacterized membrane protein